MDFLISDEFTDRIKTQINGKVNFAQFGSFNSVAVSFVILHFIQQHQIWSNILSLLALASCWSLCVLSEWCSRTQLVQEVPNNPHIETRTGFHLVFDLKKIIFCCCWFCVVSSSPVAERRSSEPRCTISTQDSLLLKIHLWIVEPNTEVWRSGIIMDIKTVCGLIFISLTMMMKHLSEHIIFHRKKIPCVSSCFLVLL